MNFKELIKNKRIALFSGHPDDLELSMGGIMNQMKNETVWIDVFSDSTNIPGNENIMDEFWKSMESYGFTMQTTLWSDIDTMDMSRKEKYIKNRMFYCKTHFKPDIVISCNPSSHNMDHSVVGRCANNVFQDKTLLFFEDIHGGSNHRPDIYVNLNMDDVRQKIKACRLYKTQNKRSYFKPFSIVSFLGMRGSQISSQFVETLEVSHLIF